MPIVEAALCSIAWLAVGETADLSELMATFWNAPTAEDRALHADAIVQGGAVFDEVLAGLREGRRYSADGRARLRLPRERTDTNGLRHPYMILVSEDYTPERSWPLRLDSARWHGREGMEAARRSLVARLEVGARPDRCLAGRLVGLDVVGVEPGRKHRRDPARSRREVGATRNADEDRVVPFGNSDGGAALFFLAMRQPDRFAGFAGAVAPPRPARPR